MGFDVDEKGPAQCATTSMPFNAARSPDASDRLTVRCSSSNRSLSVRSRRSSRPAMTGSSPRSAASADTSRPVYP
jgi:hypothetical protein